MISRLRVPAGYVLGLLALALARPSPRSLLLAVPLVVAGEAVRVWASGHLEKTRTLATGGPYAHTRNPLYLGSLIMALGMAAGAASVWSALVTLAYFATFYPPVIRQEAAFLNARFGEAYQRWAAAVPLFFPRLLPGGARESRFAWARVRRNREWRTALAVPVMVLALYARARWVPW